MRARNPLLISAAALGILALLPGCGDDSREEAEVPPLVKAGKLTISLQPGTPGPPELHTAVLGEIALRLELKPVFVAADGPAAASDAIATVPLPAEPDGREYSGPWFEDPATRTLYGIHVAPPSDPEAEPLLLEDLDEALSELKDDGTLQELYDEWLPGTDVPDPVFNDATT